MPLVNEKIDFVFSGRESLSDEQWYAFYFPNGEIRRDVVIGIRVAFMLNIPFDMKRLSPSDSFQNELNFGSSRFAVGEGLKSS